VDLAIWDCLGKLRKEPVYALIGGKTFGPADGVEGFNKNVEFIKNARESIGPDFPLMIDCYMALTVPWIEEFLPPDDYEGYAEVKRVVGDKMLLTTGEHEYTRYGFRQLIEKNVRIFSSLMLIGLAV